MAASCIAIKSGLRRVDRWFIGAGVAINVMVPGMLATVAQRCVCDFVAITCGLVGLVVVLMGGATTTTLFWLGSVPSVATLCGGCMSTSKVANDSMIDFWRRCHYFLATP